MIRNFSAFLQHLDHVEGQDQAGEHDGNGGAEFDQDVQGRAGGILEGIAHGIAHTSGLVLLGALAAVMAGLDVLLGVIPSTAGVGHKHGHGKTGDGDAAKQADHAGGPGEGAGATWRASGRHPW